MFREEELMYANYYKYQFVHGIHRSPVKSPHKGQWRGALMFSLIYVWINSWINNRDAGHLRRYRAHYDVIVMEERYNIWKRGTTYAYCFDIIIRNQHNGSCNMTMYSNALDYINSMAPDDAVWRHRTCSNLVHVTEWYLTLLDHYQHKILLVNFIWKYKK